MIQMQCNATVSACEEVLGRPPVNRKPWISEESWKKVEERKKLKQEINQARTRQQKQLASDKYKEAANDLKKALMKDKRSHYNNLADEAEVTAKKGDLKALYATKRLLSGNWSNPNR